MPMTNQCKFVPASVPCQKFKSVWVMSRAAVKPNAVKFEGIWAWTGLLKTTGAQSSQHKMEKRPRADNSNTVSAKPFKPPTQPYLLSAHPAKISEASTYHWRTSCQKKASGAAGAGKSPCYLTISTNIESNFLQNLGKERKPKHQKGPGMRGIITTFHQNGASTHHRRRQGQPAVPRIMVNLHLGPGWAQWPTEPERSEQAEIEDILLRIFDNVVPDKSMESWHCLAYKNWLYARYCHKCSGRKEVLIFWTAHSRCGAHRVNHGNLAPAKQLFKITSKR